MEIVKIKIRKDILQMLVDSNALSTDEFSSIGVDEDSYDYSSSELWKSYKAKSDKAFKELKKIEFEIRYPL